MSLRVFKNECIQYRVPGLIKINLILKTTLILLPIWNKSPTKPSRQKMNKGILKSRKPKMEEATEKQSQIWRFLKRRRKIIRRGRNSQTGSVRHFGSNQSTKLKVLFTDSRSPHRARSKGKYLAALSLKFNKKKHWRWKNDKEWVVLCGHRRGLRCDKMQ